MHARPRPPATTLESRIANRKADLTTEMIECTRRTVPAARETGARIREQLSDLDGILKAGLGNGWSNLSASTESRLVTWLERC